MGEKNNRFLTDFLRKEEKFECWNSFALVLCHVGMRAVSPPVFSQTRCIAWIPWGVRHNGSYFDVTLNGFLPSTLREMALPLPEKKIYEWGPHSKSPAACLFDKTSNTRRYVTAVAIRPLAEFLNRHVKLVSHWQLIYQSKHNTHNTLASIILTRLNELGVGTVWGWGWGASCWMLAAQDIVAVVE